MNRLAGSHRRKAAPTPSASVAGTSPIHTHCTSTWSAGDCPTCQTTVATAASTSTARGQPSISTSRQAPESCTCRPCGIFWGSNHTQGSSATAASAGVSKGPRNMRQGRSHAATSTQANAISRFRVVHMGSEYRATRHRPV